MSIDSNVKIQGSTNTVVMGGSPSINKDSRRKYGVQELVDKTEEKIKYYNLNLQELFLVKEKLANLTLKEGDVVLHEGNAAVICNISFGDREGSYVEDHLVNRLYFTLASKNGYKAVLVDEVVPYTVASKALYERS